jgi:Protein of Unknown function (DUF2784)
MLAGAEIVLLVHLAWCAWVVLGWIAASGRPVLRNLHIASLLYAIVIESVPWPPCPLTVAEEWFEARGGIAPARGPFLIRLLDGVVYPNVPAWLVVGVAVASCLAILGIYARRYRRRGTAGTW